MIKKLLTVLVLLLTLNQLQAQKIVGYLPSYRDPSTSNIQYAKVNTIVYAFINPSATGNLITTTGLGSAWDFNMTHFLTVKDNCNTYGTKLSISLGGADPGHLRSTRLNDVSGNATYRATLVSELVQFAITHNLYGIDVDWEFPTTTDAKNNHEALLAALRTAVNASANPNIKIGVAVGGEYTGGINHLNYFNNNAVQYVDDFHIMTYDFPASYDANNHSSLLNSQNSFNEWNSSKGVPKSKMYLGVPFYGRNAARTAESEYRTFSVGLASYDVDNYSGYYYNGKSTLEAKSQWVVDQGGQGIMIWDLGQDRTDTYSLLNVIFNKMSSICPAPQPNCGPDVGFCTGNVVLNSNVAQATGRTFSWKKDGSYVVTNSLTANTYTATTGGTYIVEVTQSACTKTDQILVTAGSSLGVTNATRCGPGSVTLSVNTAGGPFEWYANSTGGSVLYTGANYTFSETASTTYYVQENTGSATYGAGKAVIDAPNAWNETGYESTNSLPRFAHKIVVSQDLTIQSVKVWTSGHAIAGAKVMVISSVNGTSVVSQTSPVNLAAGASPYTLAVNLTLTPGTYYVGIYAPVGGGSGNPGVWLEPNSNFSSSQSGVFSIEGKSYANYGTGFNASATPTNHYGQLFDWVISTGVAPPCGRTAVTTTINSAATTSLSIGSTSPICAGVDGTVTVQSSETNVTYQPYIGANTVGAAVAGTGGTITLTINNASLAIGANTIAIKATKIGCGTVNLTNTASITVNTGTAPTITFANITKTYGDAVFNLSASSNSAGAFTYSFVSSTPASLLTVAANGQVTINGAGTATVRVDQAASGCYAAGNINATVTINKATLTVTATNQSRTYGAANPTAVFSYSGFVNSETSTVIDAAPTASHTAISTSNVGTAAINVSGGSDNNYTFNYVAGTLTINKATVTATANAQSRAYGAANPVFTIAYSGFLNGETSTVLDVLPTASTSANATSAPGAYTITVSGGSDNNYNITLVNGTLTVIKADRTVTITSASSGTVGGTISLTYSTVGTGTATWSNTNGTGTASVSGSTLSLSTVGTVTVRVDIVADVNYNATFVTQVITISNLTTPTVTFNDVNKTYGDAVFSLTASSNSSGAFTYSFVNSTPASILTVAANGQVTINGAGTATVRVDQAASGSFGAVSVNATVTVGKATLTATATNQSRIYGAANPTGAITYSGFVYSDNSSVIDASPIVTHTAISTTNVGNATINISGGSDNNYNFTYVAGTLTINKATITATANAQSRAYGEANPTLTISYSGLANSETSTVLDVLPTASVTAIASSAPGPYTITLSGGSDNNYNFTLVNGTLTVTKANRTVTITSASSGSAGGTINLTYSTIGTGAATWSNTNGTGTATVSGSTLNLSTVGTVTVRVDIAADANYNATFVTQVVTISNLTTPTITFNNVTKTYGDAAFTVSATSNSAGAFTYSLLSATPNGIATVASNGLVTLTGAGSVIVKVDQASTGGFGAGSATATITVGKASRTLSITSSNSGLVGDVIALAHTLSAGTGSVSWSSTNGTGTATLSGTNITLNTMGTVTVQVDVPSDDNYLSATATQIITISSATAVADEMSGNSFKVYPNPFESNSSIHFELSSSSMVMIEAFDMAGHKVNTLLNESMLSSGSYEVPLLNMPIGVYLVKIKVGSFERNIKVVKN